MTDLIFVYGSLLSRIAHPMGERLRGAADLVGAAHVQGRLYRVSWYPCAILSDDAADHVHGEVYRLRDAPHGLQWLDEYEGITPGTTTPGPTGVAASDEYMRRLVPVRLDSGATCEAWMYLYRRPVEGLVLVPSGRWTASPQTI
jgi:gamma-glutamylcyclotransferase (GGCT)/AIG2-like uncharacterized protein YtfP